MKLEVRARWLIEYWTQNPATTATRLKELVRERFECGIGAGEQALSRAYELMRENTDPADMLERLASVYWENIARATKRGELSEVRKTADSLRQMFAVGAPERVRVEDPDGVMRRNMKHLTDEQLAFIASLDEDGGDLQDDPELDN